VQDIFTTLDGAGEDKDYEIALTKLNEYFTTQKNIPYERHLFRQAEQAQGEISGHVCEQTETVGCYM
jgi:hypothetical protein